MSTTNTNFNLPSYIKENITSIRNYLKQHDLESMKIEDSKLIVIKSNGMVMEVDDFNDGDMNNGDIGCSNEIILPVNNDSQLRAAKDIISTAEKIIKVMIDDDLTEFISHPVSNTDDDIRCEVEKLYNLCQNSSSENVSNECRFIAGYYASLDEGEEPWTRTMSNFQRGCRIYYELVRLVVANTVSVGEYGEEWKRHIKKDVFYVGVKPAYLKDINRKNWPVVRETIINYCLHYLQPQQRQQQQQISRQRRQFANLFLRFHGFL